MAEPLLHHTALTARFTPGTTPLGHHWELLDAAGEQVGRTKRIYGGGVAGRTLRRLALVNGLQTGADQRAEVLDGDGRVVARVCAHNGRSEYVTEVEDGEGRLLASVHREPKKGFSVQTPDGRVLARLEYERGQPDPIVLTDAAGAQIAVLTRVEAVPVGMSSVVDMVFDLPNATENARERQAAMHLGFTGSQLLSVQMDALPAAEPLRTLVVLLPVIVGHSY